MARVALFTPRGRWLVGPAALALAALAAPVLLDPVPRLVWNTSASAPIGLWRVFPDAPVQVGDMVAATAPPAARKLAAQRHYLPANVPLIKRVAAAKGDKVCAVGPWLEVNDRPVALRCATDRQGRRLPWWRGCQRLSGDQVLLLAPSPESFDGRYFGPVDRSRIIGKATLLWRR